MYAAAQMTPENAAHICGVYNNDGPGFVTDLFDAPEFQPLQKRVHTFVPQASVVGMLLEHDEAYQVVYSTQKGIMQHDPYSWCVIRNDWYYLDDTTTLSKIMDSSMRQWILGMQPEQREKTDRCNFSCAAKRDKCQNSAGSGRRRCRNTVCSAACLVGMRRKPDGLCKKCWVNCCVS